MLNAAGSAQYSKRKTDHLCLIILFGLRSCYLPSSGVCLPLSLGLGLPLLPFLCCCPQGTLLRLAPCLEIWDGNDTASSGHTQARSQNRCAKDTSGIQIRRVQNCPICIRKGKLSAYALQHFPHMHRQKLSHLPPCASWPLLSPVLLQQASRMPQLPAWKALPPGSLPLQHPRPACIGTCCSLGRCFPSGPLLSHLLLLLLRPCIRTLPHE